MPRTAGLRTLSELTTDLTKAGLDPSRIQERAEMLAKVAGAKRKRQRDEEDAEMDVDGEESGNDVDAGEWMDVDGEEDATPNKKAKANSGTVIVKGQRQPRTNRQFAGLRDDAVSTGASSVASFTADSMFVTTASLQSHQTPEPWSKRAEYARQSRRERSCNQDEDGMSFSSSASIGTFVHHIFTQPKHLFAGKRKMGKTDRR